LNVRMYDCQLYSLLGHEEHWNIEFSVYSLYDFPINSRIPRSQ